MRTLMLRYFRSVRVLLLGSYRELDEPSDKWYSSLQIPLLLFTHKLPESMECIPTTASNESHSDGEENEPGSLSTSDNGFILPEHAEMGVVLQFSTVCHFVRYCEDLHPLHKLQRYVHGNYLIFIQQSTGSIEVLRHTVN
uniref:Uncharacterized protein n=1 Tax=Anopheles maculatus TaxID=74869 RepID=A0A182T2J2_9DIPT